MTIETFSTNEEMLALAALAVDRTVLEMGSYKGASAIVMAQAGARMVHAVDWHQGDGHLGVRDTLCEMWRHLERQGVRDQVVLHVGRFQDILPLFRPGSFDLALVDGCHEYEAIARDLELVVPLVRSGGWLACHDYGRWGVERAVSEARERHGGGPIELTNSLVAWMVA